mgnify:CR=1 FL=1
MTRSSLFVSGVCTVGALLLSACSTESRPEITYTYAQDVAPILARRCTTCHAPNGIAPFSLTTYDDARRYADAIRDAVASRRMPPFPPDPDDCQPMDDFRAITRAERDTITSWVDSGALLGDPSRAAPAPPPEREVLGPPTDVFDSGISYVSKFTGADEYRCFIVDPRFVETAYGHAFNVRSSDPRVVHHVDLRYVLPGDVAKLEALDAADPEPGYECFGGFVVDAQSLAGGGTGRRSPGGTGYAFPPGTKFVVQIHYNYASGRDVSRVAVEMWRSPVPLSRRPFAFGLSENDIVIPAGARDVSVRTRLPVVGRESPAPRVGVPDGDVWELTPHMHQLGRSIRLEVVRADGSRTCLLHVPRWDLHWQGTFRLARPVGIAPGDEIELTCTWDNSPEHQPIVEGHRRPPREVRYGPGADDEMCFAGGIVTAPP